MHPVPRSIFDMAKPSVGWTDKLPPLQSQISQALINVSANIFGVIIVMNLYYCYLLIQPYWTPILGAVLGSIALRGLKREIAKDIRTVFSDPAAHFWITIPMIHFNRLKGYFLMLWSRVPQRLRFFAPKSCPMPTTPSRTKKRKFNKAKRSATSSSSTKLSASSPDLPRTGAASTVAAGSQSMTAKPKKKQSTFPFLLVLFGIVIAFLVSLPWIAYLAFGILFGFILLAKLFLFVTGLQAPLSKWIYDRADTLATVVTVAVLLGSGVFLTGFFLVNCSLEATQAATDLYRFIDSQWISNPEFQEYVASLGLQKEMQETAKQLYEYYSDKRRFLDNTSIGKVIHAFNFTELSGEGSSVTSRLASHVMQSYSNVTMHDVESMMHTAGLSNFTMHDLQNTVMRAGQVANGLTNVILTVVNLFLFSIIYMLSQLINVSLLFVIFVTMLFYLLNNRHGVIYYAVQVLPITGKPNIRAKLKQALRDTLDCSFEVCITHAFLTWMSFKICGVQYVYISTLLSGVLALIPFLSSWIIAVPAAVQLWWTGRWISAVFVLLFHLGTYFVVDPWIYELVANMHPFFTGMSIVMGFYAFDIIGIVFGPFLVLAAIITREIFTEIYRQSSDMPGEGGVGGKSPGDHREGDAQNTDTEDEDRGALSDPPSPQKTRKSQSMAAVLERPASLPGSAKRKLQIPRTVPNTPLVRFPTSSSTKLSISPMRSKSFQMIPPVVDHDDGYDEDSDEAAPKNSGSTSDEDL